MAQVAHHYITLAPWQDPEGTSARSLLTSPFCKDSRTVCPICGASFDLPPTLEGDIRAMAAQLGGEDANIKLTIHHKGPRPSQIHGMRINDVSDLQRQGKIVDRRRG